LTASGVVSRIYTDLAVMRVTPDGLLVEAMAEGMTLGELQALTEAQLLA